jgi:hypothetical protein
VSSQRRRTRDDGARHNSAQLQGASHFGTAKDSRRHSEVEIDEWRFVRRSARIRIPPFLAPEPSLMRASVDFAPSQVTTTIHFNRRVSSLLTRHDETRRCEYRLVCVCVCVCVRMDPRTSRPASCTLRRRHKHRLWSRFWHYMVRRGAPSRRVRLAPCLPVWVLTMYVGDVCRRAAVAMVPSLALASSSGARTLA